MVQYHIQGKSHERFFIQMCFVLIYITAEPSLHAAAWAHYCLPEALHKPRYVMDFSESRLNADLLMW